jgi:hypothetical protein
MARIPAYWFRFLSILIVGLASVTALHAQVQGGTEESLRLGGVALSSVHSSVTEGWSLLDLTLVNTGPEAREARVLVFYESRPDVQYGRDAWIPARSSLATWMLLGPAPHQANAEIRRDVQVLLYDRTGGKDRLVLPPGEERVRSRPLLYRPREPVTTLMLDYGGGEAEAAINQDVAQLVATVRATAQLPPHVETVVSQFLPPTAEGLDGVDCFVLAGRRLIADPPGQLALRGWLQQGGTLWVMLDRADPQAVAHLLGGNLPFQFVDRASLTTVQIQSQLVGPKEQDPPLELEQPVDLVRVLPTPAVRVFHTVNGWPASFLYSVGRGKVLFTTVGARAWLRPRAEGAPALPGQSDLPTPLLPLQELALKYLPAREHLPSHVEAFTPLVGGEVGYSVPPRATAGLVFGVFLAAVLVLGVGLRWSRHPELLGWLAPVAAVVAAVVFIGLGEASRQAVPPTMAVAEMIDVVPHADEQPARGLLALYRPNAGPTPLGSTEGGLLELDAAGIQGEMRQRIITDTDAWHWENLALPAGLRLGPFHYTVRTGTPPRAIARFGPDGLTGQVAAGKFHALSDSLISTPTRRLVAAHVEQDGVLTSRNDDLLARGQFMASSVLSDRQQRHAAVYAQLLKETQARQAEGQSVLLTWAEPPTVPFTLEKEARTLASSLLAIPLEFERPPAETHVHIPRAFVPYHRELYGKLMAPTLESSDQVDMRLRFQVPPSVLPLKVEQARLYLKVRALSRDFTVAGYIDDKPLVLYRENGPDEAFQLDITQDARVLRLDPLGGLYLNITVGELPEAEAEKGGTAARWSIETLELEVSGRTLPDK